MKSKITIFILFVIILIGSSIFAFLIKSTPQVLPITIFSTACTILLASVALPSLLGISESKTVKGLFFILYNNFIHIFFPIYQVILAVVALITEYYQAGSTSPIFISRFLLVFVILDLFYILLYLRYLIHVIGTPGKMLKIFEKRILKKIRKKTKDRNTKNIIPEIQMLVKISKDTSRGEEKSTALNIFQELLLEVIKFYPGRSDFIPTASQYELWKILVENIYEVCWNDEYLYSANDWNLTEAIDILDRSWQLISNWSKSGFDYAVCTRALKKLADLAIKRGYNKSLNNAAFILGKIGEHCIYDQPYPRTPPFEIASDIAELGISTVRSGKHELTDQFILHLLNFYSISQKEEYLFYTLNLVSFIWDNNKDALEDLKQKLSGIKKNEINEAVEYSSMCFQRETVRIKRFLDAVNKSNKTGFLAFIKSIWGKASV